MAALTVRLALPYPQASDPDNVPGDLQALAEKVDLVALDRRGGDTITASGAAVKGLVVKGAAGQTANLQEWQNSAGTAVAYVNAGGGLVATGGADLKTTIVTPNNTSTTGLIVKGLVGLTAPLVDVQDSASNVLTRVTAAGALQVRPDKGLDATAIVSVSPSVAGDKGLVVRGVAGQVGNPFEVQDSNGTVRHSVTPTGALYLVKDAAPVTNAAGGSLWTNAAGALFYRNAAGVDTLLAAS